MKPIRAQTQETTEAASILTLISPRKRAASKRSDMSKRKTNPAEDPRFTREERDNRGVEHGDPRSVRDPERGVGDADSFSFVRHRGNRPDKGIDQSTIDQMNEATTSGGGLALDGGKLSGNRDDFEGDLEELNPKEGADPNNAVTLAHDLPTGDTGKTRNPD
jgi:hypothetical protein